MFGFFSLGISFVHNVFLHDVTNQVKNSYIASLFSGAVKKVYTFAHTKCI